MKLGVVGLPNVGKSTLFNAITKAGAEAANYPFCTIEPNVGIVAVPDFRLGVLERMYSAKKVTPAVIEFVDIAGLVKGASKGEGLGNKFLSHIREVDALVHVVRCFEDGNISHVEDSVDPERDIETINLELIFSDIDAVTKRLDKAKNLIKTGDRKYKEESDFLEKLLAHLEQGLPARTFKVSEEDKPYFSQLFLISEKPTIYAANISESHMGKDEDSLPLVAKVKRIAKAENAEVLTVCAKTEEELSGLEESEQRLFLNELGLAESGLDRLVKKSYELLGLISFLTAGEKEIRAWTIKRGTKAPQAAGKIHTDFEKGFIRAETISFDTLIDCGNFLAAKEKGKVRLEGKEYTVKDGDVMLFRFNV